MYSFAGLIGRAPLPTFSDTAITDRHPDTIPLYQVRTHGCGFPGLFDWRNQQEIEVKRYSVYTFIYLQMAQKFVEIEDKQPMCNGAVL